MPQTTNSRRQISNNRHTKNKFLTIRKNTIVEWTSKTSFQSLVTSKLTTVKKRSLQSKKKIKENVAD